ncbi:MAG: trypsin-like peptidase domain-containing protein [Patescibacteria group bacterium]
MKKIFSSLLIFILVIAGLNIAAWFGFVSFYQYKFNQTISQLKNEFSQMQQKLAVFDTEQQKLTQASKEAANREVIKQKSQDELLTAAVAKVTPAVVSIVISKDVPKLEVVYENPFGNDPFFKDFNFRVPVYRQKGTQHEKVGAGTGFLINQTGYIITNKHVVYDTAADYTVLLSDGSQKPAQVVYKDSVHDLAVIKIEGSNYTTVELGNSESLKLGQTVFAVGNALGEYNNSVSVGIISGLDRTIQASGASGVEQLSGVIQTDAAINPGNSGGPLLDLDGKAVGVNVATVVGSNNISFSIPISTVKEIIKSVLNKSI